MRWIASRVAAGLVTMFVAALVVYGSVRLVPGDPVSGVTAGRRLTPEQREALREKLGLNQDFVSGFFSWLGGVLHLDFGDSWLYNSPVNDLIAARMPITVTLMIYAGILSLLIGVVIALISAIRPGIVDRIGLVVTSVSVAAPSFLVALFLLSMFAVQLRWFPATGAGDDFGDRLYHLALPALALAISTFGIIARVMRSAYREQLSSEHVEVARSRGVPSRVILGRHVMRNTLGPLATLIALLLASLFIGTAVVETAFGVDGIGAFLVSSIARRDFPVVQAISLMAVALFVVLNTTADLLMPLIDPRIRQKGAAR